MKAKVFTFLVVSLLLAAPAWSQTQHDSAVFVIDVSQTTDSQTAEAVKIVRDMNQRFPDDVQSAGALIFGGNLPPTLSWVSEVQSWDRSGLDAALSGIKNGGGPTPMGLAMRMAGDGLSQAQGKTALIIVSDGRDNGLINPVAEVDSLKAQYGDRLCVFAIQLGDSSRGGALLGQLVSSGGCGKLVKASEVQSDAGVQGLVDYIFPGETHVAAPPPPPPPTVKDSDGDGVMNPDDECPGTLRGAKVDSRGCWVIENIRFASGSAVIDSQYYPDLDNIVSVLKHNPGVEVVVEGHTDSQGDEAMNQQLSQKRAQAVVDYLVDKGVDASRISASGKGESMPIADNSTAEGRAQNRRIEISVKE